jgi:PAS domain S-box-containing protein
MSVEGHGDQSSAPAPGIVISMETIFGALKGGAEALGLRRRAHRLYRWGFLSAAVVVLLYVAVLLAAGIPQAIKAELSNLMLPLAGLLSVLAAFYRFRRSVGRRRRGWGLMGTGLGTAFVGNIWFTTAGELGLPRSVQALGDIGILVGLLIGIAAFISFPSRVRRGTEAARMVLDGIVVGGSILYIVSVEVFPQLLWRGSASMTERAVVLLIPAADAALATLAVLLILRSHSSERPSLGLLSLGTLMYTVADLTYAVRFANGTWAFGTPIDVLWIAGYALIALAALHPPALRTGVDEGPSESSSMLGTLLVFGFFFAAAVMTITGLSEGSASLAAGVMWIGVLLAVAARQILYVVDNRTLRHSLERRVRERTAELSKLTEQSELLLSSVGEGIYGVDRHGLVTFANPAAAHILGMRVEDLIGLPAHDAWHDLQPDGTPYPIEDCYVTQAIRSGIRTHVAEDFYRRPDATTVPVEVTASPLSTAEGIQGAVVVFRDTTQRREIDRMKSEFVSVVSHELRTPLTAIRGSLGLLAGGALGELPERANRMVAIALESSERLTRLINDILDLERIEAGTTPMDLADHSVAELVDGAVEQMSVLAANAHVTLRVISVQGTVRANADRVTQTLLNLIGNAIKFSPPGTTVTVTADESTIDPDEIEFRVSDQGRGIPEDKLESIFKRFDQVDSSDAREKGGTGLGLAICRSIVERHGGRIWAESTPGEGSTFTFTLPRAAHPSHRPAAEATRPAVAVRGRDHARTEALCRALESFGYLSRPLVPGASLVSLADGEERPAAVVLEVGQSKAETAHALSELRGIGVADDIAVVVVSGWHPEDLPLIAQHANGWVLTPDDGEHLTRTVTAAVVARRALGAVVVVPDHDGLLDDVEQRLEHRGLTVSRPRSKRDVISRSTSARPHVLILDGDVNHLDAVGIAQELGAGGALADVPVVLYVAPAVAPATGHDLRLGRALFLDSDDLSPAALDRRIAELIGAMAAER